MGTAGNRKGYKVFCINTSIRKTYKIFALLDVMKNHVVGSNIDVSKSIIVDECIKQGVFKFNRMPSKIRDKIQHDEDLTQTEVNELKEYNNSLVKSAEERYDNRIIALKALNIIDCQNISKLTPIGLELITSERPGDVYLRLMITMHAHSPVRTQMLNKSRPFLNTLFVMNLLEKNEMEPLTSEEFAAFILSMKDCDYKQSFENIVQFRELECNDEFDKEAYFNKHFVENGIASFSYNTIFKDYPDEVMDKFEYTGLITHKNAVQKSKAKHFVFNENNRIKVNLILSQNKDFEFIDFETPEEYYNFIKEYKLPWEEDSKCLSELQEAFSYTLKHEQQQDNSVDEDRIRYLVEQGCVKHPLKEVVIELNALFGKGESKYEEEMTAPLRLEWFTTLLLAHKYGSETVKCYLKFNDNGSPIFTAPARVPDIVFHPNRNTTVVIEVTMITNKNQQMNNETTSTFTHYKFLKEEKENHEYYLIFVAPEIHTYTTLWYTFLLDHFSCQGLPTSIGMFMDIVLESRDWSEFESKFNNILNHIKTCDENGVNEYNNYINNYNR